jgi:predicted nucleic acid-binding Zn ribbon protein
MPLYDWKCEHCEAGLVLLKHHSESDTIPTEAELVEEKEIVQCPKADKHEWKRLIGKANFYLVGGGWFRDGYTK